MLLWRAQIVNGVHAAHATREYARASPFEPCPTSQVMYVMKTQVPARNQNSYGKGSQLTTNRRLGKCAQGDGLSSFYRPCSSQHLVTPVSEGAPLNLSTTNIGSIVGSHTCMGTPTRRTQGAEH